MPQAIIPLIVGGVSAGASIYAASAQSRAMKASLAQQQQAAAAQERSSHMAEEDAALQAAQQGSASARIARAAGKRVLAFGGNFAGLQPQNTAGLASTLGGGS